jgi:prepilin-type processing-associated H-X9-DG protein
MPGRMSKGVGGGNNNDEYDNASGACGDYAGCSGTLFDPISNTFEQANGAIVTEALKMNFKKITDGVSNTFFLGEKHINLSKVGTNTAYDTSIYNSDSANSCQRIAGSGYLLAKSVSDPEASIFGGPHTGIVNFAFGDGSVRPIGVATNGIILGNLAQRNDGNPINFNGL